ncbi:hypothetical protein GCM10007937_05280 [Mesorhizobium albiziae]|nr:hypothetical protein GCM10007937_05280 [Mesorhizobium albiziae]
MPIRMERIIGIVRVWELGRGKAQKHQERPVSAIVIRMAAPFSTHAAKATPVAAATARTARPILTAGDSNFRGEIFIAE